MIGWILSSSASISGPRPPRPFSSTALCGTSPPRRPPNAATPPKPSALSSPASSAAIPAGVRSDFDHVPIPTFIYTGSEHASERTRLEAFAYQVRQYAARKDRKG
ncbi:MAG: hypothetical protein GX465_12585 [Acidobacteria bacterium]|nr:hypothetical protein [Acidobacteriota bacterium]